MVKQKRIRPSEGKPSALFVLVSTVLIGAVVSSRSAAADVSGAGATSVFPIISKWGDTYRSQSGIGISYQAIGSGGGVKQIKESNVTFAASDMPLTPETLRQSNLVQWPMVVNGVVPAVNIPGIKPGDLVLDGSTLAEIYLGQITSWDDPAIKRVNPALNLPALPILPLHRLDGSGANFLFTSYLSKVSASFATKIGASSSVNGLIGNGAKGNEGVAAAIAQSSGAIGYLEYAYVIQGGFSFVALLNHDGFRVNPGTRSLQSAVLNADWSNADAFYLTPVDQPGKTSWPITGVSFILMHGQNQEPAKDEALKFFDWAYRNGQIVAQDLDFVPMPGKVAQLVEKRWATNAAFASMSAQQKWGSAIADRITSSKTDANSENPLVARSKSESSQLTDDSSSGVTATILGVLSNGVQQYAAVKGLQANAQAERQQAIEAARAQQALAQQQAEMRDQALRQQNAQFNQQMMARDTAYRAQQAEILAQQQTYNSTASNQSASYTQASSAITTGNVCSAGTPGNIGNADRTCQSGACYPGPDGDLNWYCTLRSSNCAWPGTTGSMYGSTSPDGSLKCVNTGPGGRAHFAAIFDNGQSNRNGNQSSSNVSFTHVPGNLTSDPSTWKGTYTVSITNTGSVSLSCSVTVHGFYDPAAGESHLLGQDTNQPFSQEDDHYVSVGSTQVFTFTGRGFNQVSSYNPICRAK